MQDIENLGNEHLRTKYTFWKLYLIPIAY
jgi:hypothetical protein